MQCLCLNLGSRGNFACTFYILHVIWISSLYGDHEFCENRYSDNHSLLQDIGEFVLVHSTFLV